ncbi:hypothetical protein EV359DRAFT_86801 [Lentinula novae-zelandiae]|nr:hypothetical protein EV359DRAFT_86801 [Lentinula novae-zelandiae]
MVSSHELDVILEVPKLQPTLLPSQQITPEACAARLALIVEAQRKAGREHSQAQLSLTVADDTLCHVAAEQAVKAAAALQAMVAARSQAQHDLDHADGNLSHTFEQVIQSFNSLQTLFTPPSMPSCHKKTPASQPATPSRPKAQDQKRFESPASVIAPAIIPGGWLELPTAAVPSCPEPARCSAAPASQAAGPWYVVYHGCNGHQGFFDRFNGTDEELSVKDITQFYEHHLYKKFDSFDMAWMFWTEVKDSGILDLLRDPPTKDEVFVVIKGASPGVYVNRMSLLIEGLAWRGGEVMSGNGKKTRFEDVFKQWDAQNLTQRLSRNGPLREFCTARVSQNVGEELAMDDYTEAETV